MELTQEDKAILAHVVVDPDDWAAHALATVGESAVTAKIERWRPVYKMEKVKPGYKNRAERDLEEEDSLKPTVEQIMAQEKIKKAKDDLLALIAAQDADKAKVKIEDILNRLYQIEILINVR